MDDNTTKREKIKQHLRENKTTYFIAFGVAGFSCLIMRGIASQPIGRGISVTAQDGISVLGKKVVMNDVSYISANRQGPPSWVTRCLETGDIYESQNAAAEHMKLPSSEISKQVNGLIDHVRGYHFERICMAA